MSRFTPPNPFPWCSVEYLYEYLEEAKKPRRSMRDELDRRLQLLYHHHATWERAAIAIGVTHKSLRMWRCPKGTRPPAWPSQAMLDRIDLAFWSSLDLLLKYAKTDQKHSGDPGRSSAGDAPPEKVRPA